MQVKNTYVVIVSNSTRVMYETFNGLFYLSSNRNIGELILLKKEQAQNYIKYVQQQETNTTGNRNPGEHQTGQ